MVESSVNLDVLLNEPIDPPAHSGCASCGTGAAMAGAVRCGNGLEKIYPTTAVRFGYMRYIGEFSHASDLKFTCGAKVVIQTKRGIEMGEQVSLTCTGCEKSVTRDQMRAWVENCGSDSYIFDAGRILREATAADLAEYARMQTSNRERRFFCQRLADEQKLGIRVIECESPFGGERIIFYFTSENRIDFRDLVRDLTREYRTRIEMRQVGARDEARLLADFETCGREVCCKVFLKTLRPITMRMAKLQKATLDPTQVSGRCGRLKCCLRYEHIGYEELDRKLPRIGLRIRTNHGEGVIINRQVLTQLVQIRTDADTLVTVVAEDITEVGVPPRPAVAPASDTGTRSERPPRRGRPERPPRPQAKPPAVRPQETPPTTDSSPEPDEEVPTMQGSEGDMNISDSGVREGMQRRRRSRRRGGRGRGRGPAEPPGSEAGPPHPPSGGEG